MIEDGKIKKSKPLPPITEDEIPFRIPSSWKWVRLGNISNIIMGQSPKGDNVFDVKVPKSVEFHQGKSNFGKNKLLHSDKYTNQLSKMIAGGTVIMSVRAPVGDVNITIDSIVIGRGLAGFTFYTNIDRDYIYYFLQSAKSTLQKRGTGSTFKAINGDTINQLLVPLPELSEQQMIVREINKILK